MNRKQTAWKKSRKFGDIYGGRSRVRLNDNIFKRAHSLKRPGQNDELSILIQDNPSRDFFFPISLEEAVTAINALPDIDTQGLTHIWLRRLKKSDYEKGQLPLAEFICGSGVRVIVLYPFPVSMMMNLGPRKPSSRTLKELKNWHCDLQNKDGTWQAKWQLPFLRQYYINNILYHEVGHHIDQYFRHWSKANHRQIEEFADQYAIQRTTTATHVFNHLENLRESSDKYQSTRIYTD
ncbi:hypothetical protein [Hahella ganghwensis]|uniref:hypothetical protein n=1 Tax=Hahella ganghwensis TaxID=286420 RepID=UPI00036B2D35|nr:hypothetical protein [Hahella ganghwensis]